VDAGGGCRNTESVSAPGRENSVSKPGRRPTADSSGARDPPMGPSVIEVRHSLSPGLARASGARARGEVAGKASRRGLQPVEPNVIHGEVVSSRDGPRAGPATRRQAHRWPAHRQE